MEQLQANLQQSTDLSALYNRIGTAAAQAQQLLKQSVTDRHVLEEQLKSRQEDVEHLKAELAALRETAQVQEAELKGQQEQLDSIRNAYDESQTTMEELQFELDQASIEAGEVPFLKETLAGQKAVTEEWRVAYLRQLVELSIAKATSEATCRRLEENKEASARVVRELEIELKAQKGLLEEREDLSQRLAMCQKQQLESDEVSHKQRLLLIKASATVHMWGETKEDGGEQYILQLVFPSCLCRFESRFL